MSSENHNAGAGKRPALFLDRDGVVISDIGYLSSPGEMILLPNAAQAIRLANEANVPVVIITNQSGVARGFFSEEVLASIHQEMVRQLASAGARIDAIYYCPHHPTKGRPPYLRDCECRKPGAGMLRQAEQDLGLDLARSVVVGDKSTDLGAAKSAGAKGILVRTGYGESHFERLSPDERQQVTLVDDVLAAVRKVLPALSEPPSADRL